MAVLTSVVTATATADPESSGGGEVAFDRFKGVFPSHIKCIAVLTPASIPDEDRMRLGVKMLEEAGIKVKVMPNTYAKAPKGKKSIPLPKRLGDFAAAWNDPEVDMILPTRGGTGAQDIPPKVDWEALKKRNVILMGFSNITCLTGPMLSQGAGHPIQGPNLGRLISCDAASLRHLKAVLRKKTPAQVKLKTLRGGDISGKVYAGHMSLLLQVQKSPFKVDTAGRVIFIECIRRPEPELKRTFNALYKLGFFDKCAGVVFCHFTRNFPDEKAKLRFFREMTDKLTCPVYYGYPYGHETSIRALDFSSTAEIKDGTLTFKF